MELRVFYVESLACVGVKGGVSEWFRIDSGLRQGCIMSTWLFNVYMDAMLKEVKMVMRRRGVRFMEDGRGDYLVSCMQMTWFCMVSQRT